MFSSAPHYITRIGFLLLLALSTKARCQEADSSNIVWTTARPLRWADFQGPVNLAKADRYAAECVSYWKPIFYKRGDSLFCRLLTMFDKKESWDTKHRPDSLGLTHEQTHFDITELFARSIRSALRLQAHRPSDVLQVVREWSARCGELQDQYDRETRHGLDEAKQREWNAYVAGLLGATANDSNKELFLGMANGSEWFPE